MTSLAVAGCSPVAQPVTALEILDHCDAFKGKNVQVSGYLGECVGYTCDLFTGKPGTERFVGSERVQRSSIGIGDDSAAFDRKAAQFQKSYVVITGRIDDKSCDGAGGTDRSAGIHPTDIRASSPEEASPARIVPERK